MRRLILNVSLRNTAAVLLFFLLLFLCGPKLAVSNACIPADDPYASASDGQIRIDVDFDRSYARVGSTMRVKVAITNLTDKSIAVPRCSGKTQQTFASLSQEGGKAWPITCQLVYPFDSARAMVSNIHWMKYMIKYEDLIVLGKEETRICEFWVYPRIQGIAALKVSFRPGKYDGSQLPADTELWAGNQISVVSAPFKVVPMDLHIVEDVASSLNKALLNEKEPLLKRSSMVENRTSSEKIPFDVSSDGVVRGTENDALVLSMVLKKLPMTSPLRFLVVHELAKMVYKGYGFGAIEHLLHVAEDPSELPNVRLLGMELVEWLNVEGGYLFDCDDYQVGFQVAPELRRKAKAVLKSCADSNDEAISSRAKFLLEKLAGSESSKDEPEKMPAQPEGRTQEKKESSGPSGEGGRGEGPGAVPERRDVPETGPRETTTGEAQEAKPAPEGAGLEADKREAAGESGGGFPVVWLAAGVLVFACAAIFFLLHHRHRV